jgi:arginine decarboxylase
MPASSPVRTAGWRPWPTEAAQADPQALARIAELMRTVHLRAPGLPIIALGEESKLYGASPDVVQALHNLHSILYLYEDTVPVLARQIMRAAEDYLQ